MSQSRIISPPWSWRQIFVPNNLHPLTIISPLSANWRIQSLLKLATIQQCCPLVHRIIYLRHGMVLQWSLWMISLFTANRSGYCRTDKKYQCLFTANRSGYCRTDKITKIYLPQTKATIVELTKISKSIYRKQKRLLSNWQNYQLAPFYSSCVLGFKAGNLVSYQVGSGGYARAVRLQIVSTGNRFLFQDLLLCLWRLSSAN